VLALLDGRGSALWRVELPFITELSAWLDPLGCGNTDDSDDDDVSGMVESAAVSALPLFAGASIGPLQAGHGRPGGTPSTIAEIKTS